VLSNYPAMLEHHQKSLELRRRAYGDEDPWTASSHNNVAAAYHDLGRIGDALAEHGKALAMRQKALGADHPNVAMSLSNIGSQYYELGDLANGLRVTDEALAIAKKSLPTKNKLVIIALGNRAALLAELGRYEDASRAYDELVGILRADYPKTGRLVRGLANWAALVLAPTGRTAEAIAAADQAVALAGELSPAAKTEDLALALWAKGAALEALGKLDGAAAAYQESVDITVGLLGGDRVQIIDALTGVARVQLRRGKLAEAHGAAMRTQLICEEHSIGGKWLARVRFLLAQTLWATEPERAVALATQARVWYATTPLARDLAEIDAWLAAHR
jgi:serine/threonine-protein kinase